jgi:hypothetical protein
MAEPPVTEVITPTVCARDNRSSSEVQSLHKAAWAELAEGVENEEQLALLRVAGCDLIQGFLFSRPLTALDASHLLWKETYPETTPVVESKPMRRSHEHLPFMKRNSRHQKA